MLALLQLQEATGLANKIHDQDGVIAVLLYLVLIGVAAAAFIIRRDYLALKKEERTDRLEEARLNREAASRQEERDTEYKTAWLKRAEASEKEIREMHQEIHEFRYDFHSALLILADGKPSLIEFFKSRER